MKKKYKVGFVGSYSADKVITAETEREAKRKFADEHNVVVSNYIVVRRKKR
jgi:hypothetical protein